MTEIPPVRRLDDQFLAELDRIDKWLANLGIKKHNRFRLYKKNIAWLGKHDQEQERPTVYAEIERQGRLTEVLSTYMESIEIVETIPALVDSGIVMPIDLLKKAFTGPADTFQEDHKSNQGRNAMFELCMAAMVAKQGLRPTLSVGNPDVRFNFGGRRVNMECKRLISESKLVERIEEGISQLDKSARIDTDDVGIVALSLSKLHSPGNRITFVPESMHPHDVLSEELHGVLQRMEGQLSKLIRPSVTALLFFLSGPCHAPDRGYTRGTAATIFPMNLSEQQFLRELSACLMI